jgi:dihydrolipoamide dehydrogenase
MNDSKDRLTCDVAVIGAGTAGLSAERSARRAGASTLLIDEHFAGTTCATVGCMPSKLLIAAGEAAQAVRNAGVFGIETSPPRIDGRAVLERVRRERDAFAAATREQIATLPEKVRVAGRARFVGPGNLRLDDGRSIAARAVIVATGSRPGIPDAFSALGDRILTNETVFELPELPRSLAVIGSGPLGLELAQAMARLGVRVTLFDQKDRLTIPDGRVAEALLDILRRDMAVHLGVAIDPAREEDGIRLRWSGASSGDALFDHVLVATGRPPALDGLDLEAAGVALDERGHPSVDRDTLQCGALPVFLAGDADGDRPVLHEASMEGAIAGRNAAAFPAVSPARRTTPFAMTFTTPPLAVIGETGRDGAVTGTLDYGDQGRAKVMDRAEGLVRLHADPRDGRLIGAVMLGPEVDQSAHLICWAIEWGKSASDLLDMPYYHPTLIEGLKTALRDICKGVHAPVPAERDQGAPSGA